jgi:Uma2 family endonuclease
VREYASAGIPLYWIVDLEPEARVTILALHGDGYALDAEVRSGHTLTVSQPFAISFDPGSLTGFE